VVYLDYESGGLDAVQTVVAETDLGEAVQELLHQGWGEAPAGSKNGISFCQVFVLDRIWDGLKLRKPPIQGESGLATRGKG